MHLTLRSKLTLFLEYHDNGALNHFNMCGGENTAPFLLLNKLSNKYIFTFWDYCCHFNNAKVVNCRY